VTEGAPGGAARDKIYRTPVLLHAVRERGGRALGAWDFKQLVEVNVLRYQVSPAK